MLSQVGPIRRVAVPFVMDQDPPHGIGADTVHPFGQRRLIANKVQAPGDDGVVPKHRQDGPGLRVHVSDPDQAVAFDAVPEVILHVQMYGVGPRLPDAIESLVATAEGASVFKIAHERDSTQAHQRNGPALVLQIQPHKTETRVPDLERAEPGRQHGLIAYRVVVRGVPGVTDIAHGLTHGFAETHAQAGRGLVPHASDHDLDASMQFPTEIRKHTPAFVQDTGAVVVQGHLAAAGREQRASVLHRAVGRLPDHSPGDQVTPDPRVLDHRYTRGRRSPPGIEFLCELCHGLELGGSQVVALMGICDHIVELRSGFRQTRRVGQDQLFCSVDDHTVLEALRRSVDVDNIVFVCGCVYAGALPQRLRIEQVHPLHGLRRLQATGFEQGGYEVNAADEGLGVEFRLDSGRPADHDRRANATLIGALLRTRGELVGPIVCLNPSIVADVHHNRVLAKALLIEIRQQLPTGLIEPLAHGPVPRHGGCRRLRQILPLQPFRRGVGRMGHEGSVPDIEGAVARHGTIDEIRDLAQALASDGEPCIAMPPTSRRVTVRHALGETASGGIPFPPLAGLQGDVALFRQHTGQRRHHLNAANQIFVQACAHGRPFLAPASLPSRKGRIVAHDPVLVWMQARDQRCEGRATQGSDSVTATEGQPLLRKPVEMGGIDMWMPHEPIIAPRLIVRDDQDNVGFVLGRGLGKRLLPRGGSTTDAQRKTSEQCRHENSSQPHEPLLVRRAFLKGTCSPGPFDAACRIPSQPAFYSLLPIQPRTQGNEPRVNKVSLRGTPERMATLNCWRAGGSKTARTSARLPR